MKNTILNIISTLTNETAKAIEKKINEIKEFDTKIANDTTLTFDEYCRTISINKQFKNQIGGVFTKITEWNDGFEEENDVVVILYPPVIIKIGDTFYDEGGNMVTITKKEFKALYKTNGSSYGPIDYILKEQKYRSYMERRENNK